jgi:WD40 repeat protein
LDQLRIDGGVSWTAEIEKAIDESPLLLAVLTEASYRSEICRAEQLRALRRNKLVIPLLADLSAERPLHLEHLQYCDFTSADYQGSIQALLTLLTNKSFSPIPPEMQSTYVTAPPLPFHLVGRPDELNLLRNALLAENTSSRVQITVLRGPPGVGKSVLANMAAHDQVVHDAFPDGVIWVEIGKTPKNLASQLAEIGRAIEGRKFRPDDYSTFEASRNRIRTVLRNKATLVILDDVWDDQQLEPFLVEAPRSHALLTTREGKVSLSVGAGEIRLGTLRPAQSLALLQTAAGREDPGFAEVAATLGHLPLALRIAGARLREGLTCPEWLHHFSNQVSRIRLSRRSTTRYDSVEASFLLSLEQFSQDDQRLFDALGIFPTDTSIPLLEVVALWRSIDPAIPEFDCIELARELDRAALIDITNEKTILLHDLVHEFARERLKAEVAKLNAGFLLACNPERKPWHEGVRDDYLRSHLAWHLKEASQLDELHQLLESYRWVRWKIYAGPLWELLADYDLLDSNDELRLIQAALRLSAHILARWPSELPSQLLGRLLAFEHPRLRRLCREALTAQDELWLVPVHACLIPPGGTLLRVLAGHTRAISALAVCPDGNRLISASHDTTLKLWELDTGEEIRTLVGHGGEVTTVAACPGGRRAVSGSTDKTIRVWDLDTGSAIQVLTGHEAAVTTLSMSADGRLLVSGSHDRTVRLWSMETGLLVREPLRSADPVKAICLTPDGGLVMVASNDRRRPGRAGRATLEMWDLTAGKIIRTLMRHDGSIEGLAVRSDGRFAVSGSTEVKHPDSMHERRTPRLKLWDLETGAEVSTLGGHRVHRTITAVCLSGDGRTQISAYSDHALLVRDVGTANVVRTLFGHADRARAVAISPLGSHAVSGADDGSIMVWDLAREQGLRPPQQHDDAVRAVAVSADGRLAVSASTRTIKLWNMATGEELITLGAKEDYYNVLALTPDGRFAITPGSYQSQELKVWDLNTGNVLHRMSGHKGYFLRSLAMTPGGERVVSASDDHSVRLWNLNTGREIGKALELSANAVAVCPDGRRGLAGCYEGILVMWDLDTGQELRRVTLFGQTDSISEIRTTSDGRFAIVVSDRGTVRLLDFESWDEVGEIRCRTEWAAAISMPDGRPAVFAADGTALKIWDLATGLMLVSFTGESPMRCGSAMGSRLIAGDNNGTVHFLILKDAASI